MAAVTAALERAGRSPDEVEVFAHGMTVVTNALLEGSGARTALVATEGFTDVVALGRQNRADLYRLCAARPAPLVPDERRFGAPERMTPDGPLRPLDAADADALAEKVAQSAPEAVAVVLLHSYRHPQHERTIGEALARALPDAHVSLSHEVVGTFREYERAATTEVDAALTPLLRRYLQRLVERASESGLPEPAIMQSGGGLIDAAAAGRHAAWMVLSGPAAGAAGGAYAAAAAGSPDVLCLDMGGTSADVCVVDGGVVRERSSGVLAGRPVALPMLDVHTVGAGGGSIADIDEVGLLRVGPRSAGADPGPAAYGRGMQPTVTDANLVLGRLNQQALLGGAMPIDVARSRAALGALLPSLPELDLDRLAAGIVHLVDLEMAKVLRIVTVERGYDPRDFTLMAFGGGGPLHACAVALELGIRRIVIPTDPGLFSALGLLVADVRSSGVHSFVMQAEALAATTIESAFAKLETHAARELTRQGVAAGDIEFGRELEMRYAGQSFELTILAAAPFDEPQKVAALERFHAAHARTYGYSSPHEPVEIVAARSTATGKVVKPEPPLAAQAKGDGPERALLERRDVALSGTVRSSVPVYARTGLRAGDKFSGPALVEQYDSCSYVAPEFDAQVDRFGNLLLERRDD